MPDIDESIEIACSAERAFTYLDDPSRQGEWQESLVSVTVEGGGPTRVGTRIREVRRVPHGTQDIEYEITEHTPGHGFAFRGRGGPVEVFHRVSVEPLGEDRCRVTATFEFGASGPRRLVLPLVRHEARRQVPEDQRRLKARLESGAV